MLSSAQRTVFELINQTASQTGISVYVVGGVVRDLLLGHDALDADIDFMVAGDARDFARLFNQLVDGRLTCFDRYFTAKIHSPKHCPGVHEIDFASARSESYESPGALPVVALAKVDEDLRRRDFSINAMAIAVNVILAAAGSIEERVNFLKSKVIDPFAGCADLDKRILRVLHGQSLLDDPTRMFRAARYAARLNAALESGTAGLLREAVGQGVLRSLRRQRIGTELKKLAAEDAWIKALTFLNSWGVLAGCECFAALETSFLERQINEIGKALANAAADQRLAFIALLLRGQSTFMEWHSLWVELGLAKSKLKRLQAGFDNQKFHDSARKGDYSGYLSLVQELS